MNLTRILTFLTLAILFFNQAQAQQLAIGEKDDTGRTYLFDEQLEGVYSNYWSGMRVGGDGSDQTDVHIRSDGKTVFEGIMSINCSSQSGYSWTLNGDAAEYSVPRDVVSNARAQFCVNACTDLNAPGFNYKFTNPSICHVVSYVCTQGEVPFSNACGCGCKADTQSHAADQVTLTPRIIPVGKWAEGIVHDGQWLWVAESGQRTVAQIDVGAGKVVGRHKVGRLPVDMASSRWGEFYTLVVTDKTIRHHSRPGPGRSLAKLKECPESMVATPQTLWVLALPSCSSNEARIVQVDAQSGRQAKSDILAEWAQALIPFGNEIWVAHARAGVLSIVDNVSLNAQSIVVNGASFWAMSANDHSIYAAGRVEGTSSDGLLVMIDPTRRVELARAYVTELVTQIISNETHVIAVGDKGGIWVYSANDLQLMRTIQLDTQTYSPRAAILHEGALMISAGTFQGENGAVFVIDNWRP